MYPIVWLCLIEPALVAADRRFLNFFEQVIKALHQIYRRLAIAGAEAGPNNRKWYCGYHRRQSLLYRRPALLLLGPSKS